MTASTRRHIVGYRGHSLSHVLECSPSTEADADFIVMELLTGGAALPLNLAPNPLSIHVDCA